MGIFDKLVTKKAELNSPNPRLESTQEAAPPSVPIEARAAVSTVLESSLFPPITNTAQDNDEIAASDDAAYVTDDEGKWIDAKAPMKSPSSSTKEIVFTQNALKWVESNTLVWAPFYRYGGTLFPARLCEHNELLLDDSVTLPDDSKKIVEFFRQVKASKTTHRDTVIANKVIPYWARDERDDPDEADYSQWNKYRVDYMRKVLEKKHGASTGAYICNTIMDTANAFLKLSRQSMASAIMETAAAEESSETGYQREDFGGRTLPMNLSDQFDSDLRTQARRPEKSLGELAYHEDQDYFPVESEELTLRVGDSIRYQDPIFQNAKIVAKIVGFTGKKDPPLLLNNNGIIHLGDFIMKLPTENSEAGNSISSNGNQEGSPRSNKRRLSSEDTSTGQKKKRAKKSNPTPESAPTSVAKAEVASTFSGRLVELRRFVLIDENGQRL